MISAADVIARLDLSRHPEGGWYAETHRGQATVETSDGRVRSTGTLIYFLLEASSASRWHVVSSDEYWTYIEGAPLELHQTTGAQPTVTVLGKPSDGHPGAACVDAGTWQAARTTGAWSLVSCVVAPGFDFPDFTLMDPENPDHAFLLQTAAPAEFRVPLPSADSAPADPTG